MKSITFTTGEFKEEKTSAWLAAFTQFAKKLDVFSMVDQVKVKMKKVDYSVRQKMSTVILSITAGCEYTSDINHKLVPDTVIAEMVGMPRFPDQSQINELLRRMTPENIDQLKYLHHKLFMQNARSLSTTETVVVDIDQSGLIANGKRYEAVLKVSTNSQPKSIAGALAAVLRDKKYAEIQAIGAGAVNQAVKAIAIARGFVAPQGIDLIVIPAFTEIEIEGEERTAIRFCIEPR